MSTANAVKKGSMTLTLFNFLAVLLASCFATHDHLTIRSTCSSSRRLTSTGAMVQFASQNMNIRLATREDLPGILEIYNEAVLNTTATYDYEPRTLEHRIAWFEEHAKENYPVFVAVEESGRVAGWSSLSQFHATRL